jgi:hypothetical protein
MSALQPALLTKSALLAVSSADKAAGGVGRLRAAEFNTRVAGLQVATAEQGAQTEEKDFRKQARKLLSTQRARIAKSGVRIEGSPLRTIEETAAEVEKNAALIRNAGLIGARRAKSRLELDRLRVRNAQIGLFRSAGRTLLTE